MVWKKVIRTLGVIIKLILKMVQLVLLSTQKTEEFQKKRITLRPVVQSDDPFGPVHWVCGDKDGAQGWTIFGVDRTSVEDRYIPWSLR